MNKKEQKLKHIFHVLVAIYAITLVISLIYNFYRKDFTALGMGVVAILTPAIVPVIFKIFKWKPVYEIYIISTIFTYFASLIGSSFHWYDYFGFDKILHFSSGIFICIGAIIMFLSIKKEKIITDAKDFTIFIIFINAVNMAIAQLWEFYEYAMLIFFNNDAINHYTQGVHDTITDMMCAFVGGVIVTGFLLHYYKTKKGNFVTNLYEGFYEKNIEKPR